MRMVIKLIRENNRSFFRLIVYGESVSKPKEFTTIGELLAAIRSVLPDFDENSVRIDPDIKTSHLVFTAHIDALSSSQLSKLGMA